MFLWSRYISKGYLFNVADPGSTKPPLRFKSTTVHQTTSTVFHTKSSDPSSFEMTNINLSEQQVHHAHQKRSNTKTYSSDNDYTQSDVLHSSSSNWTFPWDSMSKSTVTHSFHSNSRKMLMDSSNENGLLLNDDRILKQLVEETKAPVVFLSENNTSINAHSGTSVTLPCIIKKESKFEMVGFMHFNHILLI